MGSIRTGNNEEGDTAMTRDTQHGSPKNIYTMYIVKYNKSHFYLGKLKNYIAGILHSDINTPGQ